MPYRNQEQWLSFDNIWRELMADSRINYAVKDVWPSLPLEEWKDTYATLHMWMQIVGKVRLVQSRALNHWWQGHVDVTARGVTIWPIQYDRRTCEIDCDFIHHNLLF